MLPHNPARLTRGILISLMAFANGVVEPAFGDEVTTDVRGLLDVSIGAAGTIVGAFTVGLFGGSLLVLALGGAAQRILSAVGAALFWAPLPVIGVVLLTPVHSSVPYWGIVMLWAVAGAGNGIVDSHQQSLITEFAVDFAGVVLFALPQALGQLAGSLADGILIGLGLDAPKIFIFVGLATLVAGLGSVLLTRPGRETEDGPAAVVIDPRRLARWGLITGAGTAPLGIALNWARPIAQELGLPLALQGSTQLAFVLFAIAGTIGGAFLSRRLVAASDHGRPLASHGTALRGCALVSAGGAFGLTVVWLLGGVSVAVSSGSVVAVVSFALLGAGTAPIPGIILDAAARAQVRRPVRRPTQDENVDRLRRVATITLGQYGAMTAAPLLVGWIGELLGVLGATALCCLFAVAGVAGGASSIAGAQRPAVE